MGNNHNTIDATATAEAVLEHVDPTVLVVDANVRTEASVDRAFVASITERGVIQPVLATRDSAGTLHVRDGQRRTLAAREAELATIPVYVVASDAEGDAEVIERITDQLIANEHRTDLTATQRAAAAPQFIELGVSRTKVAKTTRLGSTKAVDAAVAVASSEAGINGLAWGLTIEQAAILAQFEDSGDTEAVEALSKAASEGRFDHKAAELAANATERAAIRAVTAPLVEDGYTVLDARPWPYSSGYTSLGNLVHVATGEAVTADQVSTLTRESSPPTSTTTPSGSTRRTTRSTRPSSTGRSTRTPSPLRSPRTASSTRAPSPRRCPRSSSGSTPPPPRTASKPWACGIVASARPGRSWPQRPRPGRSPTPARSTTPHSRRRARPRRGPSAVRS